MLFPDFRARRLREKEAFRRMIRETTLTVDDFILPLFAIEGKGIKNPIASMPGQFQLTCDYLVKTVQEAQDAGLAAVMLFGLPDKKDPLATRAYASDGIVQKAIKAVKDAVPGMAVITDVCLCQYTDHGHCGMVENGRIDNDASLELIAKTA
ncbi:MAG: porphobilinogen synthase, partial [Desulfamplus sp.]|nr:porphobilinogen synthase [Desulfamplus sp.]